MAARSEPTGGAAARDLRGHSLDRDEPAPGDYAGELRPIGSKETRPNLRMDTVGSDHERRSKAIAAFERDFDRSSSRDDARATHPEMDCIRMLAHNRFG